MVIRGLRYATAAGVVTALATMASVAGAAVATATSGTVTTSRTFAGYRITEPKKHIRTATVKFVVPTITCHQNFSGVGPSVLIDSTVHNHRYSYSGGGIAVGCQNKQPTYIALPIVDSLNYDDTNVPIAAGDKITLTVKYGQNTTVTLVDDTTHQVDTRTGKRSLGLTAYFGDSGIEVNHHGVGLDPFTTTSFSGATVNGRPIGSQSPRRYKWVDSSHVALVTASTISHKDHFTTTFKRST